MSIDALLHLGAQFDERLQRALNLPPEQWFAIAAILTLWIYLSFAAKPEAALS